MIQRAWTVLRNSVRCMYLMGCNVNTCRIGDLRCKCVNVMPHPGEDLPPSHKGCRFTAAQYGEQQVARLVGPMRCVALQSIFMYSRSDGFASIHVMIKDGFCAHGPRKHLLAVMSSLPIAARGVRTYSSQTKMNPRMCSVYNMTCIVLDKVSAVSQGPYLAQVKHHGRTPADR